jgi:hypothetical protein
LRLIASPAHCSHSALAPLALNLLARGRLPCIRTRLRKRTEPAVSPASRVGSASRCSYFDLCMGGGSSPSLAAPWLLRAPRIRLLPPLRRRCYARLATSKARRQATSRSFTSRAPSSCRIAAPPAHARLCAVTTSIRRRPTPATPTQCPACSPPRSAAGPSRSSAPRAPARFSARLTTALGRAALHVLLVPWLGFAHVCAAKSRACSSTPAPRPFTHANALRTPSPARAPLLASRSRPPCCHRYRSCRTSPSAALCS